MTERRIWKPAPVAIAHPSLFTRDEIDAYEKQILANPSANEHDASRFFRNHPKFLYLGSAAEVRPEVTFHDTPSGQAQRVDFFRRRFGEKFWDIIELKDPNKSLVVRSNSMHARLSAEVDKAINQAQDYRDLLDSDGETRRALESKGIRVWRPQIIVVVGKRDEDIKEELLRTLLDRVRQRGSIEAWSYNDIFAFAKEHYSSNQIICIPATHFAAIDIALSDHELDEVIKKISSNPEEMYNIEPRLFEELIARVLQLQGMDVELTTPTNDSGVDIYATSHLSGVRLVLGVQCKRYSPKSKIEASQIRQLLATVSESKLAGGIFVTTSTLSRDAWKLTEQLGDKISVIDRERLLEMIKYLSLRKHLSADSDDESSA